MIKDSFGGSNLQFKKLIYIRRRETLCSQLLLINKYGKSGEEREHEGERERMRENEIM